MTYLYYKSNTWTHGSSKVDDKTKAQWQHLSDKTNWRITQLPNGYYQTEVNKLKLHIQINLINGMMSRDVRR